MITLAAGVGKLLELSQPEVYDKKYAKWRHDDLPFHYIESDAMCTLLFQKPGMAKSKVDYCKI